MPQTAGLKQQIFSQFWSLEVQDHSVGESGFFQGLSHWHASGYTSAMSPHSLSFVHMQLCYLCVCLNQDNKQNQVRQIFQVGLNYSVSVTGLYMVFCVVTF